MRIYFDENFSPHLITGIKAIQDGRPSEDIVVLSTAQEFGRGCPDEEWIPEVAKRHGIILTQDLNIHRLRAQWDLCNRFKVGIFFFKPPKKAKAWGYWDIVQLTIRHWPAIKDATRSLERPFGRVIEIGKSRLGEL